MEFNLNYHNNQKDELKHMIYHVLRNKSYTHVMYTSIEGAVTKEPVSFKDKDLLSYRKFELNEPWGDLFDCAWFKMSGQINDFKDRDLFIKVDLSGEALLFTKEGLPLKGFTNGSSVFDRQHGEPGKLYYQLSHLLDENGYFELWFDAGANDLFGSLQNQGRILNAEVVERNLDVRNLYYDLSTLYDMLDALSPDEARYKEIFSDLREIYFEIIYEKKDWKIHSKKLASKWLNNKSTSDLNVYAVGHAHMDLAWLWPIRETKRKIGRTIANVLDLLDKYPEFVFGISQPQQIEWLRQTYPKLFERFKYYVDQNRIELQGGMWVEADTNLSGGESLIRQIYYGQMYYQDMFNKKVKNLWLPDVFGYSGNIPQIMKGSGLSYFMTTKLSWSLINRFPHHTFKWKGIDGSSVITHMPPEGTYNSSIRPSSLTYMASHYVERKDIPHALNLFGIGDGGGGPGYEHLERIKRTKDIEGLPKVHIQTAQSFFDILSSYEDKMSTYQGELYLENHQGTLTSQANLKKAHRKMESKLKSTEMLLTEHGYYQQYKEKLDDIWKEHLLYEFHDILPGSSIKRVYDECLVRYEVLNTEIDSLLREVFEGFSVEPLKDGYPFNPNMFEVERIEKIDGEYVVYHIAPHSNEVIKRETYEKLSSSDDLTFDTKAYQIAFDQKTGRIKRIYHHKTQKELLEKVYANELSVYVDLGDAWNIMDHYREQEASLMKLLSREVNHYGRFIEVKQRYTFKSSVLDEIILIDKRSNQITFKHHLDWKDVGYMLRTNFPLNIISDEAIFDIQFGEIKRPRTTYTSIEKAKFEVCGHHWVSIHDGLFGASLINDGKYGFHVQQGNLDMNLLRSTNYPAVSGDIGKTSYTYALILHEENHIDAKIDDKGLELNSYYPYFNQVLEDKKLFIFNHPDIDVSAIKMSSDQNSVIFRLYEKHGHHVTLPLAWYQEPKNVYQTNLLEEDGVLIASDRITFKPYQIITLKVEF